MDENQDTSGCECDHHHVHAEVPDENEPALLARLRLNWLRFGLSWIGIAGLWQMTNVCPICGQPSCPGGWTFAGFIGLLGAFFFQILRKWQNRLFEKNKHAKHE